MDATNVSSSTPAAAAAAALAPAASSPRCLAATPATGLDDDEVGVDGLGVELPEPEDAGLLRDDDSFAALFTFSSRLQQHDAP